MCGLDNLGPISTACVVASLHLAHSPLTSSPPPWIHYPPFAQVLANILVQVSGTVEYDDGTDRAFSQTLMLAQVHSMCLLLMFFVVCFVVFFLGGGCLRGACHWR